MGTKIQRVSRGAALGLLAVAVAACSHGTASSTSSTTSTLPPLPPKVVAYVALAGTGGNLGFGTILVQVTLTVGSQSVGQRTKVGTFPDAVAVTPDGRLALVANFTSNTVTPIVLPSGQAMPAIPVGPGPAGIAITPDGKTAYVTDAGSLSTVANTVTPIDLATMKALKPITVGEGPQGIVITPNGSEAFVADAGAVLQGQQGAIGSQVTPINLATNTPGKPITVGNGPLAVAITPDGTTVFVTNLNSESVTPINVGTGQAGAAIAVAGGPVAIVVAEGSAWVVNAPAVGETGNNLQPISDTADVAGKAISLPKGAQSVAVTPDGSTAWVACLNTDQIVPVDLLAQRAGKAIVIGGGPFAMAIANQPQGPAPATTSTTTAKATTTSTATSATS